MSDYTDLCARLRVWSGGEPFDSVTDEDCALAADAIESQAREIAESLARVTAAEDALAADPIMTDKNLVSAVITAVMSGKQSERDDACRKLQRHIIAVERERDARETECEQAWDKCHLAERLASERREECDALRAQLAAAEQDAVGLAKAIERGGFCLAEMMQAYERRIRSDCKSPDELGKRPWECAEYIAASSYLRTMFPIRDAALAQASPDEQKGGGE